MRFEVKTGGVVAILFGLALLSGVVFVMGLLAGYDVGQESQTDAQKVATDYPVTAPRSTAQTPAAMESGEGAQVPASAANGAALASNPEPIQPATRPTPGPVAPAPAAVPSSAVPPVASTETRPTHPTRKPFNIQIQAAMDSSSAGKMVSRLQALGYQPHMLPTQINGSTWYKIEVGPYATQAEAAAAEVELRQKYNSTYGHQDAPAQPAEADQGSEE